MIYRHRRGPRTAAVIAGHFSERPFDLCASFGRQHLAFEHDFSGRRDRQVRCQSLGHFHGSATHPSSEAVLRHPPTQVCAGSLKKRGLLAERDGNGTRFSFGPIFFPDDIAMMARADMRNHGILAQQHVTVGTNVDVAGFRISRHRGRRADIRTAIPLMPSRPGKLCEIHVIAHHHVLFDGTVLDVKRLDRFHLFELVLPKTNGLRIGEILRNAVDHSLASLMGEKVGQNAKSLRVALG